MTAFGVAALTESNAMKIGTSQPPRCGSRRLDEVLA
jgi:hypothetical protein